MDKNKGLHGISREKLILLLRETRKESENVVAALSNDDLSREVIIRYDREDWNRTQPTNRCTEETYDTRVIGRLLIQVSAHYGYHAGQIVVLAKMLQDTQEHVTGQYH
ncbi:hypothetical protein MHI12_16225 [Paenibacillus sp. FSL H8-0280]|uniref:hypothetical protein n=1 Tax=Paenibacillus sp. FSL H8-0280 TaxID=2921382 RepID=UPI0032515D62